MSKSDTSRCRSCNAEIVWARSEKGKNMPCDLTPTEKGGFFLFRVKDRGDGESGILAVFANGMSDRAEKARQRGDKRYSCHFETCPTADHHRKLKRNKKP